MRSQHTTRLRFRAMGAGCEVIVTDGGRDDLTIRARTMIDELESRWSRFLADSDVGRMNRSAGSPVEVSPQTCELVDKSLVAKTLTGGAFNPTMALDLEALGYDRNFDEIRGAIAEAGRRPDTDRPDDVLRVDWSTLTVEICEGFAFDPGGIGKGLAADLVAEDLRAAGAAGVLVNLGGDLRVCGDAPDGDRWVITVREPELRPKALTSVHLLDAGLATSTTLRRRWSTREDEVHHILDPSTRQPRAGGPLLATVIAAEAWWAEVAATAVCAHPGYAPDWAAALVVDSDGLIIRSADFGLHEPEPA